jgi:endosialidase-like protein
MATPLILKRSVVAGKVPTTVQLASGELAINTYDGKLFLKREGGGAAVVEIGPVTSVAGKTGAVALSKSNVGLGNANNTSDAAKPVSTATQAALSAKANLSGDIFTGTVTAPNFVSSSDARLKSDITTIANALELVRDLRGVRYVMDGAPGIGVIAQEVEPILPEIVSEADGLKRVAYGNFAGLLIEAIKVLADEIDQLKGAKNA